MSAVVKKKSTFTKNTKLLVNFGARQRGIERERERQRIVEKRNGFDVHALIIRKTNSTLTFFMIMLIALFLHRPRFRIKLLKFMKPN